MNALVALIVVAAALSLAWQLVPARPRYRALNALLGALRGEGFAARLGRGIMEPLVRRAAKGLGGGCGSCSANPVNPGAKARHARSSH